MWSLVQIQIQRISGRNVWCDVCQCLHVSVDKILDFVVGRTSVVELTIACELDGVVVSMDMHSEPG